MNQNQKRLEILEAQALKKSGDSFRVIILPSGETAEQALKRLYPNGCQGSVSFIPELLSNV